VGVRYAAWRSGSLWMEMPVDIRVPLGSIKLCVDFRRWQCVVWRGMGSFLDEGAGLIVPFAGRHVSGVRAVAGVAEARCVSHLTHLSLSLSLFASGASS
jgi:hypothetical protein